MEKEQTKNSIETHTIDAQGKRLGRVSTEAAVLLMGKHTPQFAKNKVYPVQVNIINASKAYISTKKKETKEYASHSQHLGGINIKTLAHVIEFKGVSEVFRRAVLGMLPKNKLRSVMIKNLSVTE